MKQTDDLKDLEHEFVDGIWKKFIICTAVVVVFCMLFDVAIYYIERGRTREYAAVLQKKAGITQNEIPETVNFDALHKISKDAAAWLYAPDTEINYVIAQTDNNRYYLENQLNGGYAMGGTLFIDCDNSPDLSDWNTIIYGHYLKNGTMFGTIKNYDSQDYYESHPVMYLYTPGHRFCLELIAGYTAKTDDMVYSIPDNAADRDKIVTYACEQSSFASDVTVGEDDKLVTLSTCMDDMFEKNYVVIGKVTEDEGK